MMTAELIVAVQKDGSPFRRPVCSMKEIERQQRAQAMLNEQDVSLGYQRTEEEERAEQGWHVTDAWRNEGATEPAWILDERDQRLNQGAGTPKDWFFIQHYRYDAWAMEAEHRWRRGMLTTDLIEHFRRVARILGAPETVFEQELDRWLKEPLGNLGLAKRLASRAVLRCAVVQDPDNATDERFREMLEFERTVNAAGDVGTWDGVETHEARLDLMAQLGRMRADLPKYQDVQYTDLVNGVRRYITRLEDAGPLRVLHSGYGGVLATLRAPTDNEREEYSPQKQHEEKYQTISWLASGRARAEVAEDISRKSWVGITWRREGLGENRLVAVLEPPPRDNGSTAETRPADASSVPRLAWYHCLRWVDEYVLQAHLQDLDVPPNRRYLFVHLGRMLGVREALIGAASSSLLGVFPEQQSDALRLVLARLLVHSPVSMERIDEFVKLLEDCAVKERARGADWNGMAELLTRYCQLFGIDGQDYSLFEKYVDAEADGWEGRLFTHSEGVEQEVLRTFPPGSGRKAKQAIALIDQASRVAEGVTCLAMLRTRKECDYPTDVVAERSSDVDAVMHTEDQHAYLGLLACQYDNSLSEMLEGAETEALLDPTKHQWVLTRSDPPMIWMGAYSLSETPSSVLGAQMYELAPELLTQAWSGLISGDVIASGIGSWGLSRPDIEQGVLSASGEDGVSMAEFSGERFPEIVEAVYRGASFVLTNAGVPFALLRTPRVADFVKRNGEVDHQRIKARDIQRRSKSTQALLRQAGRGGPSLHVVYKKRVRVVVDAMPGH